MTKGEEMFVDLDSSMEDLYTIQYALAYCIQSYDGSEDGLFLMNRILSGFGFVDADYLCGDDVHFEQICLEATDPGAE